MVIDEFDGGALHDLCIVLPFILEDVSALTITVTDGEVIPSGRDVRGDGKLLTMFLKAKDVLNASLIRP